MKPYRDIQQEITDTIIAQIEAGAGKWEMPWHRRDGFGGDLPENQDGKSYRGLNVILLWGAAMQKGFKSSIWGTFKNWEKLGSFPRKGEKGTTAFYWAKRCNICGKTAFNTSAHNHAEHPGKKEDFRIFCKAWTLFNLEQLDRVPAKFAAPVATVEPNPVEQAKRIAKAERFFDAIPATVKHGGNRAFYTTGGDYIGMPEFEQFKGPEFYYATRGHETVHWTGHKSRCDREFGKRFGNAAYAFEELVAELGAAFLCSHIGIANEPRIDHAQYLSHWLDVLKSDKKAIFTAAKQAQVALDYLVEAEGKAAGEDNESLPIAA